MADYKILDPEDTVECPYDKSHMVRVRRMQYHLLKCRKNFASTKDYKTCPYNATHDIPRPEFRFHMSTCPDRSVVEKTIRYEAAKGTEGIARLKGNTDVPAYISYEVVATEDWDTEIPAEPRMGVNPEFFLTQTRRSLSGMTPLEKRQFHSSLAPDVKDLKSQQQKGQYRPVGMQPVKEKENKVRLPKEKSQAEVLYAAQQTRIPQQPSTVFQYSLAMAGVGRGRGVVASNNQHQGLGRGAPVNQPVTSSPQTFSNNAGRDDPPDSIKCYLLSSRPRRRGVNNMSNQSGNFSDVIDTEDFERNDHVTTNLSNGVQSATIAVATSTRPRGRGRTNTPSPTFNMPSSGLGRGERLQNGNRDPMSNVIPPNSKSWASQVNGSNTSTFPIYQPEPTVPSSFNVNDYPALGAKPKGHHSAHSDDVSTDGSNTDSNELLESAKKAKRIRKKLTGIAKLEEKQKNGIKLNAEELKKINRREELEEQLANLSVN
ncbi:uncharacterized protein LOC126820502 [Patella vulgata]|uniref:uncharacterized protein LOC126820502 n=1 Tax=Patella vulgata TaxID=6465 RepID=UPI0024A92589|nr:uncharacterized protein LOC126820502 [Patella vulgata]XP_055957399.1 uncharacterized protein LOC126820502 [Patella vulgata]